MDALSMATAVISLVDTAAKVHKSLSALQEALSSTKAGTEFHVYTLLLQELSDIILKGAEVSPSVSAAAKLCQERLIDVQSAASARKPDAERIQAALSRSNGSIMLLRDMVMDSITHTLLQKQRETQMQVLESEIARQGQINGNVTINIDPDDFECNSERIKEMLSLYSNPDMQVNGHTSINITRALKEYEDSLDREANLDHLRSQLQSLNLQMHAAKNPFQKPVHVLRADPEQGHLTFIAKIDTQSSKNWVRSNVIEQLAVERRVQQIEAHMPTVFQGAGGEEFQASGRVILTWYESVVAKTRDTEFLISYNDAPFDLVLGWEWLKAEGATAFAEPVLAMKEINLTEAQNREMQANLFSQAHASANIAPVRRAEGINRREARRLQKAFNASVAASKAQTPAFSLAQTPRGPSPPGASPGASDG